MGMSTHVVGFRPADEKWHRMKAVWDACKAAKTEVPKEVVAFFNYEEPDEAGIEVEFERRTGDAPVTEWQDERGGRAGVEVDLEKLRQWRPQITKLRFYNAW